MSDNPGFTETPYQPGTPEYDQYIRGTQLGVSIPLSNLGVGALAQVLPPAPGTAPPTANAVESHLPGIVTGTVSGIGKLLSKIPDPVTDIENKVRGLFGLQPAQPMPTTGLDRWAQLYDESEKRAAAIAPHVEADPNDPGEQALQTAGRSVGSMLLPVPGKAVEQLPKVVEPTVRAIADYVAPLAGKHPAIPLTVAATLPLAVPSIAEAAQPTPPTLQPGWLKPDQPAQDGSLQPAWDLPDQTKGDDNESWLAGGHIAGGLGAAVLAALVAKYHTRLPILRDLPGFKPAIETGTYQTAKTEAEAAAQARASGDTTQTFQMSPQPTVPLPMSPVTTAGRKFQAAVQDRTAVLQSYLENTQHSDADIAHQIGNIDNTASINTRANEWMESGVHPETGVTGPSFNQWSRDVQALSPAEQQTLHTGLWSANELDNRTNLAQQARNPNVTINSPEARVGLYNMESPELQRNVQAMTADPKLAGLADRYWQIGNTNLEVLRRSGYPAADIAKIQADHPHYAPTVDTTGATTNTFAERMMQPYSGTEIPQTTPWHAMAQHVDDLYKFVEQNALRRRAIDAALEGERNDLRLAPMFTQKPGPAGTSAADPLDRSSVTVYRPSGRTTYQVGNPSIASALSDSPRIGRAMEYTARMRRLAQRGIAGPEALIGGKFFAPTNAFRTALFAPYNLPRGMYSSTLDRLAQQHLGFSARTNINDLPLHMLHAGVADAANESMSALSHVLHPNSPNAFNGVLRRMLGDTKVDQIQQSMHNRYMQSLTHQAKMEGALGGYGYGYTDLPTYGGVVKGERVSSPAFDAAPGLYRATNPFTKATLPYAVNMRKLLHGAHEIVSNMGHSALYRLNADNPNFSRARVVTELRQLTGDMGVRGGNSVVRGLTSAIPFSNAAIQDIAQVTRNMYRRPVAYAGGIAASLATLSAMSHLSAMHTQGGVDHANNVLTTNQRATGPIIYTNPDDPSKYTQLSLPQTLRGLYPAIHDLTGHAFDVWDSHSGENAFERAYHTLADVLSHHVSVDTTHAMEHGASQVSPITSPSPTIEAAANLMGKQPDLSMDQIIQNIREGKPLSEMFSRDLTSARHVPNQAGGATMLDTQSGNALTHVLSSIFGIAGDAWQTLQRGAVTAKHGGSARDIYDAVIDNVGQHIKDQNPMFNNILWSNTAKTSSYSPLIERLDEQLQALQAARGAKSDIRYAGYTGRRGLPLSGEATPKVSNDPVIQGMYVQAGRVQQLLDSKILPRINDLKKAAADLANTTGNENERRQQANDYVTREHQLYHDYVAPIIQALNDRLSQQAGKRIRVSDIDWSRGKEQFAN